MTTALTESKNNSSGTNPCKTPRTSHSQPSFASSSSSSSSPPSSSPSSSSASGSSTSPVNSSSSLYPSSPSSSSSSSSSTTSLSKNVWQSAPSQIPAVPEIPSGDSHGLPNTSPTAPGTTATFSTTNLSMDDFQNIIEDAKTFFTSKRTSLSSLDSILFLAGSSYSHFNNRPLVLKVTLHCLEAWTDALYVYSTTIAAMEYSISSVKSKNTSTLSEIERQKAKSTAISEIQARRVHQHMFSKKALGQLYDLIEAHVYLLLNKIEPGTISPQIMFKFYIQLLLGIGNLSNVSFTNTLITFFFFNINKNGIFVSFYMFIICVFAIVIFFAHTFGGVGVLERLYLSTLSILDF